MARCLDDQIVRQQISSHYPQARVREVIPEEDPLRLGEGEQAWSVDLAPEGPEYAPLRVFRDDDLLDPGSDPIIALLGALSNLNEGERVVARLLLRSLGPDWSAPHMKETVRGTREERGDPAPARQAEGSHMNGTAMAVLGLGALAIMRGYMWVRAGETWKAVLLGIGVVSGLALAGWAWQRWRGSRSRVYDPLLVREKVSRIAFDAEIQVVAVLPEGTRVQRAEELLGQVAAAYRHYDNPAGARFRVGKVRPMAPDPSILHPAGPGLFGRRSILGVREAAAMWHPPGEKDETPLVERSGSRTLLPSARSVRGGAYVGDTSSEDAGEDPLPPRSAPPAPPLRGPHAHGQVHADGPHRVPQDDGKSRGQGRRRHRRGRSPRRPGGRAARTGPGIAHRPRQADRPGRRLSFARDQSARHPHLLGPRPDGRLGGEGRQGIVGPVGTEDAVDHRADRQDPARGQRAYGGGRPVHHPRRPAAALG